MSDIPTFAIDLVHMFNNTSVYHDEYLAHRLAFIPLKLTGKELDLKKIYFEIDVHATNTMRNVTTKDLKGSGEIVPIDSDILICKLLPGQSLHLRCFLKEGTAEDNVKWSPVTTITFKDLSDSIYRFNIELMGTLPGEQLVQNAIDILNK